MSDSKNEIGSALNNVKSISVVGRHPVFSDEDRKKMETMSGYEKRLYCKQVAERQGIYYKCGQ